MIVLVEGFAVHPVELFPGQGGQQPPAQIQRLVDRAVDIHALVDILLVEHPAESQELLVGGGQLFFPA